MPLMRLKQRREFLEVAASGRKVVARSLVMQYRVNPALDAATARVGFTVTKKLGNAVRRNRIRRRLREAVGQAYASHGKGGLDYVVIGRGAAYDCPFTQIVEDARYAFRKAASGESHERTKH